MSSAKRQKTSQTCAVLRKAGELVLEDRPVPNLKRNEVLVSMKRVGICGSDVEYWQHGRIGDFILKQPMVIGHESAGVVAEIGNSRSNLCFDAMLCSSVNFAKCIYAVVDGKI